MIRLGIAFVVAGIFGSGADFLIRASLNNIASLNMLGLYNAGFMMSVTYAGMVFTSMETDYYPRLAAVGHDVHQMSNTVNHQVEVSLLMISPLLVAFSIGAPIIVQLLYSKEFLDVVPMIQITVLANQSATATIPMKRATISRLVIKELYCGGCMTDNGVNAFHYDKYVILYNNSAEPSSYDNLCFGMSAPANAQANNNNYLADGRLNYEGEGFTPLWNGIWYFPSTLTIEPYSQIVVNAQGIAIDQFSLVF